MSESRVRQNIAHHHDPGLLRIAQAEFLYRDCLSTFASSFLGAVTVIPVFYAVANHSRMYLWLAAFALVTVARYCTARIYLRKLRNAEQARQGIRVFLLGTLASGVLWGFSGLYFINFSQLSQETAVFYTSLYVLYCCALSSGCLSSYAAHPRIWYSFAIPCLTPLITILALADDTTRISMSFLMVIYFIAINRNMRSINETIMTSLILRLDNVDITRYLEQERERVYQLNTELKQDIQKRKQTEEALRQAKAEAEKLADDLLTLSTQDSLTGIANRRALDRFLHIEWNRAKRHGKSIALILCDIDYYKSYNDIYGHQAGDDVLIRIARLLHDSSRRSGELAARYGGEEFVIVLADTTLQGARFFAEQIRGALAELAIPHSGSIIDQHLTMSFGVSAVIPATGITQSDLVGAADTALYEAKARGRNYVVSRHINPSGVEEAAALYHTDIEYIDRNVRKMINEAAANSDKVIRHSWEENASLSEAAMRHKLESMGYRCNRYDYPPGTVFDYHHHADDKIDAVLSGCLRLTTEAGQIDLKPGDYAVIPRGVLHKAEVIGDQTVVSIDGVKKEGVEQLIS